MLIFTYCYCLWKKKNVVITVQRKVKVKQNSHSCLVIGKIHVTAKPSEMKATGRSRWVQTEQADNLTFFSHEDLQMHHKACPLCLAMATLSWQLLFVTLRKDACLGYGCSAVMASPHLNPEPPILFTFLSVLMLPVCIYICVNASSVALGAVYLFLKLQNVTGDFTFKL